MTVELYRGLPTKSRLPRYARKQEKEYANVHDKQEDRLYSVFKRLDSQHNHDKSGIHNRHNQPILADPSADSARLRVR